MLKLFAKDPYAHIIAFIDAAVESRDISAWLDALENQPDHMRAIRLAEIKHTMKFNQAPEQHIEIIELMNNTAVLQAMNNVIRDVHLSGLSTKKFIKKQDNSKYNLLISLIASASK